MKIRVIKKQFMPICQFVDLLEYQVFFKWPLRMFTVKKYSIAFSYTVSTIFLVLITGAIR